MKMKYIMKLLKNIPIQRQSNFNNNNNMLIPSIPNGINELLYLDILTVFGYIDSVLTVLTVFEYIDCI